MIITTEIIIGFFIIRIEMTFFNHDEYDKG